MVVAEQMVAAYILMNGRPCGLGEAVVSVATRAQRFMGLPVLSMLAKARLQVLICCLSRCCASANGLCWSSSGMYYGWRQSADQSAAKCDHAICLHAPAV